MVPVMVLVPQLRGKATEAPATSEAESRPLASLFAALHKDFAGCAMPNATRVAPGLGDEALTEICSAAGAAASAMAGRDKAGIAWLP